MKYYMKGRNDSYDAITESCDKREITVQKGSRISVKTPNFRMMRDAVKAREYDKIVNSEGVLLENVTFKSSYTAAQFVSASSKNGLDAWHIMMN